MLGEVEKSIGDSNDYHLFELPNKLQVLLIEDNNRQKSDGQPMAYCSLAVNAGSFNDPVDRQGLAHFCEHMVFMGSERYPDVNIYSEHIAENGGYCNAYTEFEWTNYYQEVSYLGLEKALDMIACNMDKPLLTRDTMDKELNAVESEFKMIQVNDAARSLQIVQSECASKDNIFSCFAWGNMNSLKGNGDSEQLW